MVTYQGWGNIRAGGAEINTSKLRNTKWYLMVYPKSLILSYSGRIQDPNQDPNQDIMDAKHYLETS